MFKIELDMFTGVPTILMFNQPASFLNADCRSKNSFGSFKSIEMNLTNITLETRMLLIDFHCIKSPEALSKIPLPFKVCLVLKKVYTIWLRILLQVYSFKLILNTVYIF
jgi:hypothetical protein